MFDKKSRPAWWSLYLSLAFVLGLLLLEARAHLSVNGHRAVEVGLVLILYGIVWVWLNLNERVLYEEEREKRRQELRL